MLIIKNGCRSAGTPIDVDDLLEILIARIKRLTSFVSRITSVFTNEQNTINSQVRAAKRQGLGDRRIDLELCMPPGSFAAQVILANLFDIQRHDIHLWSMMASLPTISLQEAVDDMLGVGEFLIDRRQSRDLRPFRLRCQRTPHSQNLRATTSCRRRNKSTPSHHGRR